jgi:hypothetical protein
MHRPTDTARHATGEPLSLGPIHRPGRIRAGQGDPQGPGNLDRPYRAMASTAPQPSMKTLSGDLHAGR